MYNEGCRGYLAFFLSQWFEVNETAAYEQLRGNTWEDPHEKLLLQRRGKLMSRIKPLKLAELSKTVSD